MKGVGALPAIIVGIVVVSALSLFITTQQPSVTFPHMPGIGPHITEGIPAVHAQDYQYIYQQEKDTLTVTGSAVVSTEPDKVTVTLGAETERTTALQSQQDNAQIIYAIRAALTALGIPADSIETTSFRISVVRDYRSQPYQIIGYKTTHILKITTENIDMAGQIIDAAAGAGANVVNSVTFGLTRDVQSEMREEALEAAARNAREKADSIATGLEVTIIKVTQASEGYVGVSPYRGYDYDMAAGGAAESTPPTEITTGDVDVSATVTVVYEIA